MRSSALERESLRSAFMGAIVAPSWLRAKNFIVNVAYILICATRPALPFSSGVIALQKSVANGLLFATIFATKGAP